jgi:hypothetical protein
MIGSLAGYLRRDELYGSVGGGFLTGGSSPQLTIGAVLMRLRRLKVLSDRLNDSQQQKLQALDAQHSEIRNDNTERYIARMEREALSRLKAMSPFFEECGKDMSNCARNYNPEVLRRTIVQEILLSMDASNIQSEEVDSLVAKTDRRLRTFVQETGFLWDEELEPAYPKETFWWLYMAPRS